MGWFGSYYDKPKKPDILFPTKKSDLLVAKNEGEKPTTLYVLHNGCWKPMKYIPDTVDPPKSYWLCMGYGCSHRLHQYEFDALLPSAVLDIYSTHPIYDAKEERPVTFELRPAGDGSLYNATRPMTDEEYKKYLGKAIDLAREKARKK